MQIFRTWNKQGSGFGCHDADPVGWLSYKNWELEYFSTHSYPQCFFIFLHHALTNYNLILKCQKLTWMFRDLGNYLLATMERLGLKEWKLYYVSVYGITSNESTIKDPTINDLMALNVGVFQEFSYEDIGLNKSYFERLATNLTLNTF